MSYWCFQTCIFSFAQFRVPAVDFDVVILAGDISVPASKVPFWACRAKNFGESKPIIFVPGNHEFYGGIMSSTLTAMRRCGVNGWRSHLDDVVTPPAAVDWRCGK